MTMSVNSSVTGSSNILPADDACADGRKLYCPVSANFVSGLEVGFQAGRETVTRLLPAAVYGVDHPDEDSRSAGTVILLYLLRRQFAVIAGC
jgi:hypothetical protein